MAAQGPLSRGRLSRRRGRGGERRQASHPGGTGELCPTGLYQLLPQAWTRVAGVEPLGGGLVGISWPSHTDPVKGHVEHDGSAGGEGGCTGRVDRHDAAGAAPLPWFWVP